MGQVLRITFDNTDHTFEILNTTPVSKETEELQILLDGVIHTLICRNKRWLPKDSDDAISIGLVAAIGKAIALRYRI